MANNVLSTIYSGSNTIYAIIRQISDSTVWNGTSFVTWVNGNITTYDIPLTDRGGDLYSADFPTTITTGIEYRVSYYEQLGATPAITDTFLSSEEGYWNGTNLVTHLISSTPASTITIYDTLLYCQLDDVKLLLPTNMTKQITSPIPTLTPNLTNTEITDYIVRADQMINGFLQQYYGVPLRRIKKTNPNVILPADSFGYPDPIPFISSRLSASMIYNEKFTADSHTDASTYGEKYMEQAMKEVENIQSGLTQLIGQVRKGERYRKPESMRLNKFPGYEK